MEVIIAGDYFPSGRVVKDINNNSYSNIFGEIKNLIKEAHFSVVNFEFPLYSDDSRPIIKCGPNLGCNNLAIEAIKYAGFNVCTLANNHILDQGEGSCLKTKAELEKNGLNVVGVGKDINEASNNLYLGEDGKKIAIINCCEHEFSIATETHAGANPLNPIQQYYRIKEARENADFVIVIVHGGHEHYNLPSPRMVETYRFFVDAGADAVVNHHQHCYSGYEVYNGKPIFYGLGNFCFDKLYDGLPTSWHEGYMVELTFEGGQNVGFKLIPYFQCKGVPKVALMTGKDYKQFFENIERLNVIIAEPRILKKKHDEWMEANGSGFEQQFLPYSNRWLISAYIRHLFPSFLSKEKLLSLQNHLECESHRERSLYALNKLVNR